MSTESNYNGWEPPIDFKEHQLPNFPIDIFPKYFKEYIEGVSRELQVPVDMPAMMGVTILSTLLTRKYSFYFAKTNWNLDLNLYNLILSYSGNNKTGVKQRMMNPLTIHNEKRIEEKYKELPAIINEISLREKLLEKLALDYSKKERTEDLKRREKLIKEIGELKKQKYIPKLFISGNITQEKLYQILIENDEKITIATDEFSELFDIVKGKYTNQVDINLLLQAYDGVGSDMDRAKYEEYKMLKRPLISMGAFAQPVVLKGFDKVSGRGFIERFLFSIPKTEYRPGIGEAIPYEVTEEYNEKINTLLSLEDEESKLPIEVDESALEMYIDLVERANRNKHNQEYSEALKGWYGKLVAKLMKVITLMHVSTQISNFGKLRNRYLGKEDLSKAQTLFDYFEEHAKAVFGNLKENVEINDIDYLLSKIIEKQEQGIVSLNTIQQLTKHRFNARERDKVLDFLVDYHQIKRKIIDGKRNILVSPYLYKKST